MFKTKQAEQAPLQETHLVMHRAASPKEREGMLTELAIYVCSLIAILVSVPYMHDALYDRSKLHIASIQFFKTD
jgi:hypothetical protein